MDKQYTVEGIRKEEVVINHMKGVDNKFG